MEILNNLWLAVSTPNEMLMNIIAIPCAVIENILIMMMFVAILNIPSSRKQKLLYVIFMTIVGLLSMYIIPNPFNIFFNFGMMIVLAYKIFKISFLKSTASILSSAIGFNVINSIVLNPYITLLNIDTSILLTVPIYKFFYIVIMYLLIVILIFIIKNRNLKLSFMDNIDKKSKFIIFSNLILGLLTIILQCITLFYYVDKLPIIITFSNAICLVLYFAINIYSLTRIFKLILTTRKLQSAEEYNHSLRVLHDSVRSFKHDFDNMVTTIGGYIKTNDMGGLEKYYAELVDDAERVNNLYILNPEVVNNDGIYNLLTKKYHEADSKDIKVNITFLLDLNTLHMKIYEFARILGILLDNAIEASSECEEKIINLIFRDDSKNHTQLIIIENTYADKTVDTEKIFEKGISGKENHTGLGLWKVRKLVNKNQNVVLRTIKDDKFFKQQLEIYY